MTPEDLGELHRAAFVTERPWSAKEFATLLAQPHTRLTKRPGGFALWRIVAGEAELLTIAVDPAHQGRGLGTALMTDWMAQAKKDADTAFLEVASDNGPACRLYAKAGFLTVGTRRGYYKRQSGVADALLMRAPL